MFSPSHSFFPRCSLLPCKKKINQIKLFYVVNALISLVSLTTFKGTYHAKSTIFSRCIHFVELECRKFEFSVSLFATAGKADCSAEITAQRSRERRTFLKKKSMIFLKMSVHLQNGGKSA